MRQMTTMHKRFNWNRNAQLLTILLCAFALKLFYSTSGVNQLRWILTPTTLLVELVSGESFTFESHAGYMSSDHRFLIAQSCSGMNFLMTSFLMLSLRKLWISRSQSVAWRVIPITALVAYLATLVANTFRISIALQLRGMEISSSDHWLAPGQLHRFEGIFIYFGFLLLLFIVSERLTRSDKRNTGDVAVNSNKVSALLRNSLFPLLIYYATTLALPIVNAAYRSGNTPTDFWEHLFFVLLTPLLLMLPLATFRLYRSHRANHPLLNPSLALGDRRPRPPRAPSWRPSSRGPWAPRPRLGSGPNAG